MKYTQLQVKNMKPGMEMEGCFLLAEASVKTTKNGGQYLAGKLQDVTGAIDFKQWDYKASLHEHVGEIVKVRGTVTEYNGAAQVGVDSIWIPTQNDAFDISKVVPSAPIDIERELKELKHDIDAIADVYCHNIATMAYIRMEEVAKSLPAAKGMHHAFLGGWLMHTHTIMRLCANAADVYDLDKDLVVTAALCHDMAKRKEFVLSEVGLVKEYSAAGRLLGHITMGAEEIKEMAIECGIPPECETVLLLQHCVLSHHGQLEFGSPIIPKCREALLLSEMDMLDAKLEAMREATEGLKDGEMSEFNRALGCEVYCHHRPDPLHL